MDVSMKKAFTLLEIVFVFIIVGILSVALYPKNNSNSLQKAAIQLLSHIKYTQHLAMTNDNFNALDSSWYRQKWQLIFITSASRTEGKIAYTIYKDNGKYQSSASNVKANNGELALDPLNNAKYLSGGTQSLYTSDKRANKKMNLGLYYGINSYTLSEGCRSTRISFDSFGRPFSGSFGNYSTSYKITSTTASPKLINKVCIITLSKEDEGSIAIHIDPETGYAKIIN